MDKEDWLRLAEKTIEHLPNYLTAVASLITAMTVASKTKKRKPSSRKRKR
ncbi:MULTISPECIES: hypothetical protein [Streptococcus]|nr:hypothetical protein [Streptococcus canis]MDV6021910.1 hypothetical protein [Streptococcus canis]GFE45868.1 hypothetical protein ScFU6_16370 [Streptococcus canis]